MNDPDTNQTTDPEPWWRGTVIPTELYRLKEDAWGKLALQRLVKPTGGGRGRWLRVKTVSNGASDDE